MRSKKETNFNHMEVQQLANKLIADWISERNIKLRPADRSSLVNSLIREIPEFLSANQSLIQDEYIASIRNQEVQSCIDDICALIEPVPGLVSKQQVLNRCAYRHDRDSETA